MKNKNIILIFLVILIIQFIVISRENKEEVILFIHLRIFKNDTVNLEEIKVMPGRESFLIPGTYKIQLLDKNKNIIIEKSLNIAFYIMTEPPIPIDEKPMYLRFTFYPNMTDIRYLRLIKNEKEIFLKEISLCNFNNLCESWESHLSCPSDCPLNLPDRVCIKDKDGICDPDCEKNIDPDCIVQKEPKKICLNIKDGICEEDCPEDPDCRIERRTLPIWILIVIIFVIIAIIFIYYYRKAKFIKKI